MAFWRRSMMPFTDNGFQILQDATAALDDLHGDGQLLIFYSGHGGTFAVTDEPFLVPADSKFDDPETFWPIVVLLESLSKSVGVTKLMLIDGGRTRVDDRIGSEKILRSWKSRIPDATAILWSCSPGETDWIMKVGGPAPHSVFSIYVLDFLRRGRLAKEPISWDELVGHLRREVPRAFERSDLPDKLIRKQHVSIDCHLDGPAIEIFNPHSGAARAEEEEGTFR